MYENHTKSTTSAHAPRAMSKSDAALQLTQPTPDSGGRDWKRPCRLTWLQARHGRDTTASVGQSSVYSEASVNESLVALTRYSYPSPSSLAVR